MASASGGCERESFTQGRLDQPEEISVPTLAVSAVALVSDSVFISMPA